MLLGGKPGAGQDHRRVLQWARSMAQRGIVAVYLCFEHDEGHPRDPSPVVPARRVDRGSTCSMPRSSGDDELQARIRDVGGGPITLREALDSDPRRARRIAGWPPTPTASCS